MSYIRFENITKSFGKNEVLKNIDLEILLWLSDKNDCVCVRVKGEHSGPEGAAWLGKAEKSIGRRGIL